MSRPVVLIGFMTAGKTAVGQILAAQCDRPFIDLDLWIARKEQRSVAEILRADGEEVFRRLERRALEEVLTSPRSVVAVGGGTPLDGDNRRRLRELATVVWLDLRIEDVRSRLTPSGRVQRPLLDGADEESLLELFDRRRPVYAACAHLRVVTSGRTPRRLARSLVIALGRMGVLEGETAG